jgi:hypothetical protein
MFFIQPHREAGNFCPTMFVFSRAARLYPTVSTADGIGTLVKKCNVAPWRDSYFATLPFLPGNGKLNFFRADSVFRFLGGLIDTEGVSSTVFC